MINLWSRNMNFKRLIFNFFFKEIDNKSLNYDNSF